MLKIGEATESGIKKKKLVAPKIGCAIMRVQNAKEIDNMTFGEKLSSLRKEANLTQKDLAVMLDVSRQAVTKWETGVGMPDIDNIKKIASIFKTSIDELIDYKVEDIKFECGSVIEAIDNEQSRWKNVDNFVLERFSNADSVVRLIRQIKLSFWQEVLDIIIGPNIFMMVDYAKTGTVYPYLVSQGGSDYLVIVSKGTLMTKKLNEKFEGNKMVIDGYKYTKVKWSTGKK